jgi:hypothetical protein
VRLPIRIERERRLLNWLTRIESGDLPRGAPKKIIETLLDLYTAFLRAQDKRWPNFTEAGRIEFNRNAISKLIGYIKLDPFIKRVEEAIVTLHGGDVAKANEILQAIVDEKDAIASEMQRANRKGKSKDTNYTKLLKEIVKKNPDISAKDLSAKLEKEIGMGVIRDINYRSDTIVTAIGEEYKISGLKDQIYKLRRSGI